MDAMTPSAIREYKKTIRTLEQKIQHQRVIILAITMIALASVIGALVNIYKIALEVQELQAEIQQYSEQMATDAVEYANRVKILNDLVESQDAAPDDLLYQIPMSNDIVDYIRDAAIGINIDPAVLAGLIEKESSFDPKALSDDGHDYGLCQIRDSNHEWIEKSFNRDFDWYDAKDSIDAAVFMLYDIIANYQPATYHGLLMFYNLGPTKTWKMFDKGIHQTDYSEIVMTYAAKYGYDGSPLHNRI